MPNKLIFLIAAIGQSSRTLLWYTGFVSLIFIVSPFVGGHGFPYLIPALYTSLIFHAAHVLLLFWRTSYRIKRHAKERAILMSGDKKCISKYLDDTVDMIG